MPSSNHPPNPPPLPPLATPPLPTTLTPSSITNMAREHADAALQRLTALGHHTPSGTVPRLTTLRQSIFEEAQRICNSVKDDIPSVRDDDLNLINAEIRRELSEMYLNLYLFWIDADRYRCCGGVHGPPVA